MATGKITTDKTHRAVTRRQLSFLYTTNLRAAVQRYGNLTVFKMATVRHLGFVKFKFLTVGEVKRHILHQRTKFRKDRSNRCGDIAFFDFKMAAAAIAILDFKNSKF